MAKCKHYNEFTWGEPPMDPGEDGRLITEYQCKNASGYFEATCEGDVDMCHLPDNQNKEKKQESAGACKKEKKRRIMSTQMTKNEWDEIIIKATVKQTALTIMIFIVVFLAGWFMGRWELRSAISYADTMVIGGEVYEITEK